MKCILLVLALFAPMVVNALSSDIAWTPETLKFVKNGYPEKGQMLAKACYGCHGEKGEGMPAEIEDDETIPSVPALAGQLATYTYKQLQDYKNGNRTHMSMTEIVKDMSKQDAADLAAWFSTLPTPTVTKAEINLAKAEKMVSEGDGKRILPPCSVCHGSNGKGEKMDIPALAGQQSDYLIRTLLEYKSGKRQNDIYSRMRLISQQLSVQEIKDLGQYYQQLK